MDTGRSSSRKPTKGPRSVKFCPTCGKKTEFNWFEHAIQYDAKSKKYNIVIDGALLTIRADTIDRIKRHKGQGLHLEIFAVGLK